MSNSYVQGIVVRSSAAFSQNGAVVDPSTVAVVLREPNGVRTRFVYGTDAAVTRVSQGNYRFDYTTVMPGSHAVYWVSTGTGASGGIGTFDVQGAP